MKKRYFVLVFLALLGIISFNPTYSYYISNMNATVTSIGSNMTCDAEIVEVSSSEKSIYGYSEFKVIVKNYDNLENVSNERFNYTLTIENDDLSSGLYGYNNDNFSSSLTFNGTMGNTVKEENNYIIQVKSNSGLSESTNYKVSLNCNQIY